MSYTIKYVCNWCGRDDDEREDANLHAARCPSDPSRMEYARRPAAAQKKRLKDEPWPYTQVTHRFVSAMGEAIYTEEKPRFDEDRWYIPAGTIYFCNGKGYDSTDWQNSLERRPE